ncbi:MAG TPA: pilus assembly protein TadG-related protein [Terriglobales bacterium]|nr:pilus assembly protein TadG-related protein [Terriglobales bacterium]
MIRRRKHQLPRNNERGVTMLLVVVAMLSMLGVIALAIDVITLYSARSETQRAADAAAIAAAKMLVDMGVTTDPTATVPTAAQIDAATRAAQGVATKGVIAGQSIQTADVTLTFPGASTAAFIVNPRVTVTVQNTNLPTFFSRIWSRAALTVRASATAEGFNPSNSATITGTTAVPIMPRCVKPFIVPNCDPLHGGGSGCGPTVGTLFDPATGAITSPGVAPGGIIGEGFDLFSNCGPGPGGCTPGLPDASPGGGGPALHYYPAVMPAATRACPLCAGGTNFEEEIGCCNPTPISCGTTVTLPAVNQLSVDTTVYPEGGGGPAQSGVECLIHQTGGSGMDNLLSGPPLTYPLQIEVGNGHPLNGSVLAANDLVTTSDSLVMVPVYDGVATPGASVNIIGFLQVFIDRAFPAGGGPKAGEFHVTVVNVLGCGSSATGTAVASTSAVPVRLIQ